MTIQLTETLSLPELVIGISCTIGLALAVALAYDFWLDVTAADAGSEIHATAVIGVRIAAALALINLLFEFYVIVAAITPPPVRPQNATAQAINVGLFEFMLLTMAVVSVLSLRGRARIRQARKENHVHIN